MSTSSGKLVVHALFIAFLTAIVAVESSDSEIQIRFYVHDVVQGDNATIWPIAQSTLTNSLPSNFGLTLVTDTPIRASAESDSQYLGQIQGLISFTDMKKPALTVIVTVVFTEGEYSGSTLSLVGRNPTTEETRVVSVVAGTGAFQNARGRVITRTHSVSADQSKTVYQYDATLLLPQSELSI